MSGPAGDVAALAAAWPEPLRERVRVLRGGPPRPAGELVLYWMRTAVRGSENPALDVALRLAADCGRPVFVYQELLEDVPWASDRHHRFVLEGARDAAGELAARGVGHAFHLERVGHRGSHLEGLAARAAAVVTEDAPIAWLARRTRERTERAEAPLLAVDAACIVPLPLVARPFERAFAFRRATEGLRRERVGRPWRDEESGSGGPLRPSLPFEPVPVAACSDAALAELVAACDIDHGVGPVSHTRGGSRAGTRRWERFRDERLRDYGRDRNDPLRDGTSRLSPYLHHGHVSPLRIAREAAASAGAGARKFLDELLVWRELAWHFCFHRPDHGAPAALPAWARETLAAHEADPRPARPSWETLARARTGDALWDAAQRSLLVHGELHNNVRMTWGKALPFWTRDAAEALALLADLNHRFALDGNDPASWGGLLWCLGGFDRPFPPARPVLGTVRPRDTAAHARRLDVARYAARTGRPARADPPRVAVVGAGIAGLACARTLADHGLAVRVFDKGRGPGGRASSHRRADGGAFDHGAQYLTARDPHFARFVRSWIHDGVVAPWEGRIVTLREGRTTPRPSDTERLVGVPRMSALARHLAADLDLACGVRVAALARRAGAWELASDAGEALGRFDVAVVATPPAQAAPLLAGAPELAERVAAARLAPCLAAMGVFAAPVEAGFDGAFVEASPLAWAAREASRPSRPSPPSRPSRPSPPSRPGRPGRPGRPSPGEGSGECWVLHATPDWSEARLEAAPDAAAAELVAAFARALGRELPALAHLAGHRWRFARAIDPLPETHRFDAARRIGACGDWCGGDRIESAWRSGVALAGRILGAEAPEGACAADAAAAGPGEPASWAPRAPPGCRSSRSSCRGDARGRLSVRATPDADEPAP